MEKIYIDGQFIRDRITQLRLQKGVSEREMSLSLGMCESYIRNITTPPSLPSMDSFLNICEYFAMSPGEFFDTDLNTPITSKQTLMELERLFGHQLPILTGWLGRLDRFHAGAFLDAIQKGVPKAKRKA